MGLLASIPSPSSGVLKIGPLSIHAYGLMIALGVVAGVWLGGRRMEQRHVGTRDDMGSIAVWGVIAGVIGARLYHVITDWSSFHGHYVQMLEIWRGGLGIPGGLLLGAPVGLWAARRRGLRPAVTATCVAPAIPLAQAIGRLGNWFNQELFGKPTTLPWGLKVSVDKTIGAGYPPGTLFQPTFLYEMLWNLALCGALLAIDRKWRPRDGSLFAYYVIGYGIGRFWVEGLRIDTAHHIAGLRLNQWTSLVAIVAAGGYLLWVSGRPAPAVDPSFDPTADDPTADDADDVNADDVPADDPGAEDADAAASVSGHVEPATVESDDAADTDGAAHEPGPDEAEPEPVGADPDGGSGDGYVASDD
jgi:prolipoprotein diacylglyceryl transferase